MNTRVKEVRKKANLTQTAFGDRLGITQNYVALIESGQRIPSDRTIRDICREFNINETWLRTGIGDMTASKSRQQEMAELVKSLMADRPESFRSALVTALLRFDPDGPEWEILERIYDSIAAEAKSIEKENE